MGGFGEALGDLMDAGGTRLRRSPRSSPVPCTPMGSLAMSSGSGSGVVRCVTQEILQDRFVILFADQFWLEVLTFSNVCTTTKERRMTIEGEPNRSKN